MKEDVKVESRKDSFVDKAQTAICQEIVAANHEYLVSENYFCGYSQTSLLEKGYGYTDMVYLMTRGELPTAFERQLLDSLSVALCNPGPRHPATRAVMEAAVSKTAKTHLLPIGLMVLGGNNAAGATSKVMSFLRVNRRKSIDKLIEPLLESYECSESDEEIIPGFGPHFKKRESLYSNLSKAIYQKYKTENFQYLRMILDIDRCLERSCCGVKPSALVGAVLLDLGFHPRFGPSMYQLLASPGLVAHAIEMSNKNITAMPFVGDENYHHVGISDE